MLRIGTAYFESHHAAKCEYGEDTDAAITEGLIKIGKPVLRPGETLRLDKESRRYFILVEDETND